MKILYLSKAFLPSEISNSLSIVKQCEAFGNSGNDVLLTGIKSKKKVQNPIDYYGLKKSFKINLFYINPFFSKKYISSFQFSGFYLALKYRKVLNNFKPDIIYSRLTLFELLFTPSNIPIYYEMHSLGFLGKSWIHKHLFLLMIRLKNFEKIIVTTKILEKLLKKYFKGKIAIVVARLSAEKPISISDQEITGFRLNCLKGNEFNYHIGYTGYIDKIGLRGTDIICKIAYEMPDIAFHIVGGKSDIVDFWKEYSKTLNKNKNIFFYGYRKPSEMPYFLGCFDIVLAPLQLKPSRSAPTGAGMSPLKIAQYLSYSKPIVASRIPAHKEVLINEINSLLVSHDKPTEWINAIKRLLVDQKLKFRLSNQALTDYNNFFTPNSRVNKILESLK